MILRVYRSETDNQMSFGITGTARERELENGDALVVGTGRSLLGLPGEGLFLTIGRVTYTVTPTDGPFVEITILESKGKVIDVCARLAGDA